MTLLARCVWHADMTRQANAVWERREEGRHCGKHQQHSKHQSNPNKVRVVAVRFLCMCMSVCIVHLDGLT